MPCEQGEEELLEALGQLGFEGLGGVLKRAGVRLVSDLYYQGADEARLALLCPDLPRPQRRLSAPPGALFAVRRIHVSLSDSSG